MKQTAVEWLIERLMNNQVDNKMLEQAKELEKQQKTDTSLVTRVEVIQHSDPYNGRVFTNYNAKDVEMQLQDEGRTLKIFLK